MRIAIASDAWHPQVNGVVRALAETERRLRQRGWTVELITPETFRTLPCPTYPEIRLALRCRKEVVRRLEALDPTAVHIATEGPIGWAVRRWCIKTGRPFTTSFHTRFPDYVAVRTRVPAKMIWPMVRRFHSPAERVFAVTPALAAELTERRIGPVHRWPLGADLSLFAPGRAPLPALAHLPGPIMLCVGRVAVEKNLPAFLSANVPGTKVVVGDGPALDEFRSRYPDVLFLGTLHGAELAAAYAAADVFVFPSRTDTFGLVNIEALASGLPIAAYPVAGPLDILGPNATGTHGARQPIGALDEDLAAAIRRALDVGDRNACVREAAHYGWDRCTDQFEEGLAIIEAPRVPLAA